jgi:hypothetical protein
VRISPLFGFCPQFSLPTQHLSKRSGVSRGHPSPVPTKCRVLDIGCTPEFRPKKSGVGCPSGARPSLGARWGGRWASPCALRPSPRRQKNIKNQMAPSHHHSIIYHSHHDKPRRDDSASTHYLLILPLGSLLRRWPSTRMAAAGLV